MNKASVNSFIIGSPRDSMNSTFAQFAFWEQLVNISPPALSLNWNFDFHNMTFKRAAELFLLHEKYYLPQ